VLACPKLGVCRAFLDEVLGVDADVADTEQHDLSQPGVDT